MTDDPLGLGGLLFDACRLCQLFNPDNHDDVDLCEALLDACSYGLSRFVRARPLAEAASNGLVFRELGLAIGLKGVSAIVHKITECSSHLEKRGDLRRAINLIQQHVSLGDEIVGAWLPHAERQDKAGEDTRT